MPMNHASSSSAPPAAATDAPPGGPVVAAAGAQPGDGGEDPVLQQLKHLQESISQKEAMIERLRRENVEKEQRNKVLSAEKRKEMEEFFKTAIESWLGSLTGVSDDNKNSFRSGIQRCAEEADPTNAAWEIVCNA